MLHDTEGSLSATLSEFTNPLVPKSAHYVIGKSGRVIQMVKDADIAYHAKGTWALLPDCLKALPDPMFCSRLNAYTIGIELELLATDPDGYFTDLQYQKLGQLLVSLTTKHPEIRLTREWVKGHGELQSDRTDPRGLDFFRLGL